MTSRSEQFDRYALMALTSACNQKCIFCFEADTRYEIPKTEELYKILDGLAQQGFSKIVFIGGEATMVPELPDIIAHISGRGMKAHIATNGLRLDDRDFLKRLLDAGLRHIEFSIHSHIQPDSSRLTGRADSLRRQIAALENIAETARLYRPPLTFNTNTVITSVNAGYLPELAGFILKRERVNALSFKYPTFEGRMVRNPDSAVKFSEVNAALLKIREMTASRGVEMLLDGFPLCALPPALIAETVIFYDIESLLFGYNYSRRAPNRRFDLVPPKRHPGCGSCVASALCIGFPDMYIDTFSDGEVRPFTSFFDIPENIRGKVVRCLRLRLEKDTYTARPSEMRGEGENDIPEWTRRKLSAAEDMGAKRTIFDIGVRCPDSARFSDFLKTLSSCGNGAAPLVICRAAVFADPDVLDVFTRMEPKADLELLLYSCDGNIHNELAGDALFRRDCIGIMNLVERGARPGIFTPVSGRNAGGLVQLAHFAGMTGVRGIRLVCTNEKAECSPSCVLAKQIREALRVARIEYPPLEISLGGFSLECLPRRHRLYAPPFSKILTGQ